MERSAEKPVEELSDAINELVMKLIVFLSHETETQHARDATALSVAALGLVLSSMVGMMIVARGEEALTAEAIMRYLDENKLLEDCSVTAVKEILPALLTLHQQQLAKKADA